MAGGVQHERDNAGAADAAGDESVQRLGRGWIRQFEKADFDSEIGRRPDDELAQLEELGPAFFGPAPMSDEQEAVGARGPMFMNVRVVVILIQGARSLPTRCAPGSAGGRSPSVRRPLPTMTTCRIRSSRGASRGVGAVVAETRALKQSRGSRNRKSLIAPGKILAPGGPDCAAGGTFPASVLSERTGTPVPTIHHYRHLGLLPEPIQLASNRFLYDERHVEALDVIRLLRERRNLPLEVIRDMLPDLLSFGGCGALGSEDWDVLIDTHLEHCGAGAVSARLVAAAREAFAQHGYAGVNVADICVSAGIAKGSFYRYFDSKDEIFLAAARSTVEAVGDQLDKLPAPMSERQATERLQLLLGPMAPLLLEVALAELRRQPNLAGVVAAIAAGLATRLGPRLATRGDHSRTVARRVVDAAMLGLLRSALGPAASAT
jgi:AcrR family transcriptional regulator